MYIYYVKYIYVYTLYNGSIQVKPECSIAQYEEQFILWYG